MPPEFLTRYAGVFFDVHICPPKRHSNFQSVGIYIYIQLFGAEYGKLQNAVACEVGSGPIGRWQTLSFFGSLTPHLVGNIWIVVETAVVTPF